MDTLGAGLQRPLGSLLFIHSGTVLEETAMKTGTANSKSLLNLPTQELSGGQSERKGNGRKVLAFTHYLSVISSDAKQTWHGRGPKLGFAS